MNEFDFENNFDEYLQKCEDDLHDIDAKHNVNTDTMIDSAIESDPHKCPNPLCNSTNVIADYIAGCMVCITCARRFGDLMDENPEWKSYGDDGGREVGRCNKIINQLLKKSSARIGVAKSVRGALARLDTWTSMDYDERALKKDFNSITHMCTKNKIPKKMEYDAHVLYKMVSELQYTTGVKKGKKKITRGKNREGIIITSLKVSCRINGLPFSNKEMSIIGKLDEKSLRKGEKTFCDSIKKVDADFNFGTTCSQDFIQRKCDELNLKQIYTDEALYISKNVDKLNIASNHTSYSLAASCILMMIQQKDITKQFPKKHVAKTFMISDVTINKTFGVIKMYQDIILDNKKTDKFLKILKCVQKRPIVNKTLYDRMKKFKVDYTKYAPVDDKLDYIKHLVLGDFIKYYLASKPFPKDKNKFNEIMIDSLKKSIERRSSGIINLIKRKELVKSVVKIFTSYVKKIHIKINNSKLRSKSLDRFFDLTVYFWDLTEDELKNEVINCVHYIFDDIKNQSDSAKVDINDPSEKHIHECTVKKLSDRLKQVEPGSVESIAISDLLLGELDIYGEFITKKKLLAINAIHKITKPCVKSDFNANSKLPRKTIDIKSQKSKLTRKNIDSRYKSKSKSKSKKKVDSDSDYDSDSVRSSKTVYSVKINVTERVSKAKKAKKQIKRQIKKHNIAKQKKIS